MALNSARASLTFSALGLKWDRARDLSTDSSFIKTNFLGWLDLCPTNASDSLIDVIFRLGFKICAF